MGFRICSDKKKVRKALFVMEKMEVQEIFKLRIKMMILQVESRTRSQGTESPAEEEHFQ